MIKIDTLYLIPALFVSVIGLICIYCFFAFVTILFNRLNLSRGSFRDFVDKLILLSGLGFLFALWMFLFGQPGRSISSNVFFITNIFLISILVVISYTTFSLVNLIKLFGFKKIEEGLGTELKKKKTKKK